MLKKMLACAILFVLIISLISVTPIMGAGEIKVQYQCGDPGQPADNAVRPYLQVVNNSTSSVTLSTLKIRYWYTKDGTVSENFVVDFQGTLSSKTVITGIFGDNAQGHYMEVGFTSGAGSLAANGGNTGRMKVRANKSDWSLYSESDDYSYDPTKAALADWNKVTLYQNGVLIWGVEPGGGGVTPTATRTATSTVTPANSFTPTPTSTPSSTRTATPTPTVTPSGSVVYCDTVAKIQSALLNAQPGQRIVIKSGTYLLSTSTLVDTTNGSSRNAYYYSTVNGSSSNRISIESETPSNPAILSGPNTSGGGYVLYITGDYWDIKNLKITNGQKGIIIDNANYINIIGCEVYIIGDEGIHIRDGSCNAVIDGCKVHDTGLYQPGFGEGIYIGSDRSVWDVNASYYNRVVLNNTVKNCTLGPGVAGEHLDIKEGTFYTLVTNNTMYGAGISGENFADSFIDIKGRNATISNNNCYRQSNSIIAKDFAEVNRTSTSPWCPANETSDGSTTNTSDGNTYSNNTINP